MAVYKETKDYMRTSMANYPESSVIAKYKEICLTMLRYQFPGLTQAELAMAIDYSISKRFHDTDVKVNNNYKNRTIESTLLSIADYIIDKEPITTSWGVLFNRHGTVPNPLYGVIDGFINSRGVLKNEMFKYPKGSEEFEKYNLLQLLAKIDANGYYGATGMYSCLFYNLYAAASTTTQGRSCNSAAALFCESFLNNNVPWASINQLVEFIHNVLNENHHYNDHDIITIHASVDEVFFRLMASTGFGWVPSEDDMMVIWNIVTKLNQSQLDRLFYKNNLFAFVDNVPVKQAILYILQQLEEPFMNPNKPPKEIEEALKEFCDVIKEYVYYDKQIIDRLGKMDRLIRTVSIIQDTDSAIISLDGWYEYIRKMCIGIPMKIKNQNVDAVELIESGEVVTTPVKIPVEEYDFINDDIIEMDRLIDPITIIPQDGLRYSIINIIAYCMTDLINDYMEKYCQNAHTTNERACLIVMKNEFLFKRVLITNAKKHYASKMELQEGNIVPEEKSLDVKGMDAFVKSSTNPAIQERLKQVLYEDILNSESIDQIQILRDIARIEKEIYDSINNGEKKFFKPVKVKSQSSYENPMRIQGISASYAYNMLHEPGTEALDMTIRNSIDIVKVDMNVKNIDRIKDTFPGVYARAIELFKMPQYSTGVSAIAIPVNEPVPGWVMPFIQYAEIINNNVSGFPIESIGIYRGSDKNNTTNMIQF